MNAKTFLNQTKKLDQMIKNKLLEKEQWKSVAFGTTAPIGGEKVQTSGNLKKMEDAVVKFIDVEKEIDECIDRLIDTKRDIINVIELLPSKEYDVMHKRYIQDMTFSEIGWLNGKKTESWATTVHGRALVNVQKILDEREKNV